MHDTYVRFIFLVPALPHIYSSLTCASVISMRGTLTVTAPPLYSARSTVTPFVSWRE